MIGEEQISEAFEDTQQGEVVAVQEQNTGDQTIQTAEQMQQDSVQSGESENSELPKYQSFEEFSLGASSAVAASEAVLGTFDVTQPVSDAMVKQVSDQLADIEELLKCNFSEQDDQEFYPQLLDIKTRLVDIKVSRIKADYAGLISQFSQLEGSAEQKTELFSQELAKLVTQNPEKQKMVALAFAAMLEKSGVPLDPDIETFTDAYKKTAVDESLQNVEDDLEDDSDLNSNPEFSGVNEKKRLTNFKKYVKTFGAVALFTGQTLKEMTFDKNNLDLGAFFSFMLNPTGRFASSSEFSNFLGENGEVPYHMFKDKFKNFKDVGHALALCSTKLAQYPGFKSWEENNRSKLVGLKERANSTETVAVLQDLNATVLSSGAESQKNWVLFSKEFASALFGHEGLSLNEESITFVKKLLANDATELKQYWNIGESSQATTDEGSTSNSESDNEDEVSVQPESEEVDTTLS